MQLLRYCSHLTQMSRLPQPTELATPSRQVGECRRSHDQHARGGWLTTVEAIFDGSPFSSSSAKLRDAQEAAVSRHATSMVRVWGATQVTPMGSVNGGSAASPCTPRLEGLVGVSDFFQVP